VKRREARGRGDFRRVSVEAKLFGMNDYATRLCRPRPRRAFTLMVILAVVAIIGLLAVIAVPGYMRSRQKAQGRAILEAARIIDHAIDLWAAEHHIVQGTTVNSGSVSHYIKDGQLKSTVAKLKNKGGNIKVVLTVNTITIGDVGAQQVTIHKNAKKNLPLCPDWGDY